MALVRFSDVVGHQAQRQVLARAVLGGRPHHAYLFEGPAGVGKTTVARALVARLACLDAAPDAADACGRCRSCKAFAHGGHPDIEVLARTGASIRIAAVREAIAKLRYEPVVGAFRAVIVEEADLLREEAANALLKTLEEPRSGTIFVLVTDRPQRVLGTILSRTQRLRFGPLAVEDVAQVLQREGADAGAAGLVAPLAGGSLHAARQMSDPARLKVADQIARYVLTLPTREPTEAAAFVELLSADIAALQPSEAPLETDAGPAMTTTAAEARRNAGRSGGPSGSTKARAGTTGKSRGSKRRGLDREGLQWTIDVVRAALRDALVVAVGADPQQQPQRRLAAELSGMAGATSAEAILRVLDACDALDARMVMNPNPRLALEHLLVEAGVTLRTG